MAVQTEKQMLPEVKAYTEAIEAADEAERQAINKAREIADAANEASPGWAEEIDLETLDIASGYACVTAQLSGKQNYRIGMKQLGLTSGDDGSYIAHGFNVENCGGDHIGGECPKSCAYAKLNTLWREVIEGRLSASPEPAAG